jgi:hypothetical protein
VALVRVLRVPDCPNAVLLDERLTVLLAGRCDVSVEHEVIDDVAAATRAGMAGSPTLLIDGVDPFAVPDQVPSVSCRLYRDKRGRTRGVPSVEQLRAVLAPRPEPDEHPTARPDAGSDHEEGMRS